MWSARVRRQEDLLDAPLTVQERERAARMARPLDRARHLSGRALLRWAVAGELGVDARYVVLSAPGPGQRPTVRDAAIHVSVAHSGHVVVVAACREAEVGVDVERTVRGMRADTLRRWLPGAEEPLGGWDPDRMTASWVRREAVLKATGRGLAVARPALRLSRADEPAWVVGSRAPLPPASAFALVDLAAPAGYRAAVAVVAARPPAGGGTDLVIARRRVPAAWLVRRDDVRVLG